jgi:hypothetical protein
MSGKQTLNGKAFEYACLNSLYEHLVKSGDVEIEESPQLDTARKAFLGAASAFRHKLNSAANAAARALVRLEPQLEHHGGNIPLTLSLQTDKKGQEGDVRDVLCVRKQNEWEIGLSCKHNHHAVKHSRLSATIDFGKEWFGIPCGASYFNAVTPLFNELAEIRRSSGGTARWADNPAKMERFYIPLLRAFMDELLRLSEQNPRIIPERMIHYLVGRNDFYKIITDDSRKTTRIEAINMSGTLNCPADGHTSIVNIPRLKLPSRFYSVDFKENSNTTIEVVCSEGWTISMRIHNASSRVEPSLKFDVNLVSLPNTVYAQAEPW